MDASENIFSRKSVRKFLSKEIEQEKIDTLLKAAMSAPSAMNFQPWHFVVIKEKENKDRVIAHMPFGKYDSPVIIIPCVKNLRSVPFHTDLSNCDLSAASENILLAAHALGLGAVWCAIYPSKARAKAIKKELGLSFGLTPFCAIYIGYPDPNDKGQVKNKYKEKNVSYM